MGKTKLKTATRLRVLEMATEIAAEAADNTNVVWMIEFQEELIERLYRKMIALLEEGDAKDDGKDGDRRDGDRKDDDEKAADPPAPPTATPDV